MCVCARVCARAGCVSVFVVFLRARVQGLCPCARAAACSAAWIPAAGPGGDLTHPACGGTLHRLWGTRPAWGVGSDELPCRPARRARIHAALLVECGCVCVCDSACVRADSRGRQLGSEWPPHVGAGRPGLGPAKLSRFPPQFDQIFSGEALNPNLSSQDARFWELGSA